MTDAQCTELVNAALAVALAPTAGAYRSPWRCNKQVAGSRLKRLLQALDSLDLDEHNAGDVVVRLQAIGKCEADEGRPW